MIESSLSNQNQMKQVKYYRQIEAKYQNQEASNNDNLKTKTTTTTNKYED